MEWVREFYENVISYVDVVAWEAGTVASRFASGRIAMLVYLLVFMGIFACVIGAALFVAFNCLVLFVTFAYWTINKFLAKLFP